MNAYSENLRKKTIEAPRRGMVKSEAASTFYVSLVFCWMLKGWIQAEKGLTARLPR